MQTLCEQTKYYYRTLEKKLLNEEILPRDDAALNTPSATSCRQESVNPKNVISPNFQVQDMDVFSSSPTQDIIGIVGNNTLQIYTRQDEKIALK